ncbi:glycerophosphodiester phosphodiesterase [Anatilimnocola floriformis]|uniref:glycerophosphodiester phosphodiesterase n=1 Tax=Anatilimnocola floriformis TaxID=2948575 RepID=UPI0020C4B918|nr:glycerophosphodiester phosphodiesterase family protein [Anatilimnocola floriformis]
MFIFVATAATAAEPLPMSAAAIAVKQIIAHRGASSDCPENTLASTRRAIAVHATAIEVDVRLSKDRQLVLRHDAELERTTNGKGKINEKTLAELKQLDAGSWFDPKFAGEKIPTLAEVVSICKGQIDVLLDLKEDGSEYAELVAATIKEHGEESRTIVGVRSVEHARQFRKLLPKARQLGLMAKPDEIEAYAAAGVEMISLWPKWLSSENESGEKLVARVRAAKVQLHLNGTTGKRDEVLPLLTHRPDSLSADNPAQLLATLREISSGK